MLQKGFALLAHAARDDLAFVNAAGEELGTWKDACLIFRSCTVELLYQISRMTGDDVGTIAERLAVGAAQAKGAATQ